MTFENAISRDPLLPFPPGPYASEFYCNCQFSGVFVPDKLEFCNGQCKVKTKAGTDALTGFLGRRARSLMRSIFASIFEKKLISQFGSFDSDKIDGTSEIDTKSLIDYDFALIDVLRRGYLTPRRAMLNDTRPLWLDAAKKLWEEYRSANTKTTMTFGSIFPDCPYFGEKPEWPSNTEPLSWKDLADIAVTCAHEGMDVNGIFRDITMRAADRFECSKMDNDLARTILRSNNGRFKCFSSVSSSEMSSDWAPFLRHYIGLIGSLVDGGDGCFEGYKNAIFSKTDDGGRERAMCRLVCHGEDFLYCWSSGLTELKDCGYITAGCHVFCYDKVFLKCDNIGTLSEWAGHKYNPFAVSLALAVLASFQKYQLVDPSAHIGTIDHKKDTVIYSLNLNSTATPTELTATVSRTCSINTFSQNAKTTFGFGVNNVKTLSGNRIYEIIKNLRLLQWRSIPTEQGTPTEGDLAYVYYRCHGFDEQYAHVITYCGSTTEQGGWEMHLNWSLDWEPEHSQASVTADRTYPIGRTKTASSECNFIHLSVPSEDFPAGNTRAVTELLESTDLRHLVSADFGYDRGSEYGTEGAPHYRMLGTELWPSSEWLKTAAFGLFNNGPWTCQCRALKCILNEKGLCSFSSICSNWNDDYLGFGSQMIYDCFLDKLNYWCDEKGCKHDVANDPPPVYDKIRFVISEEETGWYHQWVGTPRGCATERVIGFCDPNIYGSDAALLYNANPAFSFTPKEDGERDFPAGETRAETNVVFGGYFEVNTWNFSALKRVTT